MWHYCAEYDEYADTNRYQACAPGHASNDAGCECTSARIHANSNLPGKTAAPRSKPKKENREEYQ